MSRKKQEKQVNQIVVSVLAVAILIVAVVGISVAVFVYSKSGSKVNSIETGTITMTYNEADNGISITDAMPMNEDDGKLIPAEANNVFDFNVNAKISGKTTINYDVTAKKIDEKCTLTDSDVKLYLEQSTDGTTDWKEKMAPKNFTPGGEKTAEATPATEMLLTSGQFSGKNETDYYRLRMWVDESYKVQSTPKTYTIAVNVYGNAVV